MDTRIIPIIIQDILEELSKYELISKVKDDGNNESISYSIVKKLRY